MVDCREQMYTRSVVLHLSVEASEVMLRWRDVDDEERQHFRQSQDVLSRVIDAGSNSVAHASSRTSKLLRSLMSGVSGTETFIAAIAHLKIQEDRPDPRVAPVGSDIQQNE